MEPPNTEYAKWYPRWERILDLKEGDLTFRVEWSRSGVRRVEDELLTWDEAVHLADRVWQDQQPMEWVYIISERTGARMGIDCRDLSFLHGNDPIET